MEAATSNEEQITVMPLEAFADPLVPGNKRGHDERAIASVSHDGGAVACSAL